MAASVRILAAPLRKKNPLARRTDPHRDSVELTGCRTEPILAEQSAVSSGGSDTRLDLGPSRGLNIELTAGGPEAARCAGQLTSPRPRSSRVSLPPFELKIPKTLTSDDVAIPRIWSLPVQQRHNIPARLGVIPDAATILGCTRYGHDRLRCARTYDERETVAVASFR